LSNPIRWEKRIIKQKINNNLFNYKKLSDGSFEKIELENTKQPCYNNGNDMNWNDIPNTFEYKYIRALLGLNESIEFLAKSITDGVGYNGSSNSVNFKYIVQIKSNNEIERFQSPLIAKYIDGTIYFCANSISPLILNNDNNQVSFNMNLKLKKNNKLQEQNHFQRQNIVSNLQTPSEFDIKDFLKFCFEESQNNGRLIDFIKLVIKKVS
jgi:hypothetical protein